MKKLSLFIMGMVCLFHFGNSQTPINIEPLNIGERLPEFTLKNVLNYKDSTIALPELGDIPVIFDFFSTWCGACREGLPRLDSLQKQFNNKLQIIVVSPEPVAKIEKFLARNRTTNQLTLPFVAADTLLMKFFPHDLWPHEVWIDKFKNVKAITSAYYVTAQNIADLINGNPLNLPLKKDKLNFNSKDPLLSIYEEAASQPFYSIFGKAINGLPVLTSRNKNSKRKRFLYTNASILHLYREAVPQLNNRMVIEGIDSSRLFYNPDSITPDEWRDRNTYCYELTVPPNTHPELIQKYIVQDLNRHLRLNGHKEDRTVKCWALVLTEKDNRSFIGSNGPSKIDFRPQNESKIFKNISMKQFISILNHQSPGLPQYPIIINETNYYGKINIKLTTPDIHNIQQMRKALKTYHLGLKPVKRSLEMFILTKK